MSANKQQINGNRRQFASLQAGRAIASVLVVLFHASTSIFNTEKYWNMDPFHHLFDFGHSGVEFFFVLSGFIILHAHRKDLNKPESFVRYIRKRFIRIYPIFWIVLAAIIPVFFLFKSLGKGYETNPYVIISSLLLVHINTGWSLTVSWTLFHEILFYFLFAIAILNLRIGLGVMALWFLGSCTMLTIPFSSVLNEFLRSPLDFYLSPLHLLFVMGMLGCWWQSERNLKAPRFIALLGLAIFTLAGLEEDYYAQLTINSRNLLFGLGSILALVGCLELEEKGHLKIPVVLQLLGNASYSIYLTHFSLLSLFSKIFFAVRLQFFVPNMIAYFMIVIPAILIGIGVHLLIEKPLLNKLSGRSKPLGAEAG